MLTGSRSILEVCGAPITASLLDAMRVLDGSGVGIVLVTDADGCLIGTLTDGDIRRAILRGAPLAASVEGFVNRAYISVRPETPRGEVIELMQARYIEQIPIVDEQRRVVGLHRLHAVLGAVPRPNWAVIMAGGRGSRLLPLTESIPKPMIKVAGRPILERIVLHLVGFGIRRIFLSVNYLGDVIERHFGDGSRFGCTIEYLREERPLGTGGALALLPDTPADPLIVMNGDLVTEADLGSMLLFHSHGKHAATLGVRPYMHVVPFGCLDLDGTRVLRMEEKPRLMNIVNAGIYVLDPKLLARIPRDQEFALPALLEQCLAAGEPVHAFEIDGDWIDVGQREQLRQARGESNE